MRYEIFIVFWLLFIIPLFIGKGIVWPAQQLFVLMDNALGFSLLFFTWIIQIVLLEIFTQHKNWVASAGLSLLMLLVCIILTPRLTFFTDTLFYMVYHAVIPPDFLSEGLASFFYYSWFYGVAVTFDTMLAFVVATYYRPDIRTRQFFKWLFLCNCMILAVAFTIIFTRS